MTQEIEHKFVDSNGYDAWPGPTRLGADHEIASTSVSVLFNGTIVFTHTLARQEVSE